MRSTLSFLAAVAGAYAQTSSYTDANTGITFEGYQDMTGFLFGLAVPEDPVSDFIGQIVGHPNTSHNECDTNTIRLGCPIK